MVRSVCVCAALLASAAGAANAQKPAYLTNNPYLGPPIISPYDARVSPYSPQGALNPYASTSSGRIKAQDGTDLGRLNANRYDPQSVANPYGQYGSRYSPTSINNPYGAYGSKYSPQSPNNPYATQPPVVIYSPQSRYSLPSYAEPRARTRTTLPDFSLPDYTTPRTRTRTTTPNYLLPSYTTPRPRTRTTLPDYSLPNYLLPPPN